MKLHLGLGGWLWAAMVTIGCILLAVNFSRYGWNLWGVFRGPGGRVSTALYGYEFLLSAIAIPGVVRGCRRIEDPRLRASVGFVCLVLVASNLIFACTIGISMLSSTRIPGYWGLLTFMSAVITSILPILICALASEQGRQ